MNSLHTASRLIKKSLLEGLERLKPVADTEIGKLKIRQHTEYLEFLNALLVSDRQEDDPIFDEYIRARIAMDRRGADPTGVHEGFMARLVKPQVVVSLEYDSVFTARMEVVVKGCEPEPFVVTVKPKTVVSAIPVSPSADEPTMPVNPPAYRANFAHVVCCCGSCAIGGVEACQRCRMGEHELCHDPEFSPKAGVHCGRITWEGGFTAAGRIPPEEQRRKLLYLAFSAAPRAVPAVVGCMGERGPGWWNSTSKERFVSLWTANYRTCEGLGDCALMGEDSWIGALACPLSEVRVYLHPDWMSMFRKPAGAQLEALSQVGIARSVREFNELYRPVAIRDEHLQYVLEHHPTKVQRLKLRMLFWQSNPPITVSYDCGTALCAQKECVLTSVTTDRNKEIMEGLLSLATGAFSMCSRFRVPTLMRDDQGRAVHTIWGNEFAVPRVPYEWTIAFDRLSEAIGRCEEFPSTAQYAEYGWTAAHPNTPNFSCAPPCSTLFTGDFQLLPGGGAVYCNYPVHSVPYGRNQRKIAGNICEVRGLLPQGSPRWQIPYFRELAYQLCLQDSGVIRSLTTGPAPKGMSMAAAYFRDVLEYCSLLGLKDIRHEKSSVLATSFGDCELSVHAGPHDHYVSYHPDNSELLNVTYGSRYRVTDSVEGFVPV